MNVRYRVELSRDERDELTALLSGGKHAARTLKRAQILLAADAGAGSIRPLARAAESKLLRHWRLQYRLNVHPASYSAYGDSQVKPRR